MDKSDYIRLLCETLISDQTKFTPVGLERSPTRRLPKYYHPQVYSRKKNTSYQMSKESFPRKQHIPSARKAQGQPIFMVSPRPMKNGAMPPILSTTDTYKYALAKQLDEKLKPSSIKEYTISNIFQLSEKRSNICKSVTMISWYRMSQPFLSTFRQKKLLRFWQEKKHSMGTGLTLHTT